MKEINELFQEVFDDSKLVVTKETNALEVEEWDSFAQITLVIAFEEKYNITFSTKEIGALTCVGDIVELIKRKRAEK